MRALSEADYLAEAAGAFRMVFASEDAFDAPIAANMEARALLLAGYDLAGQIGPLDKATRAVNESTMFLSFVPRPTAEQQAAYPDPFHYAIDVDEFTELWLARDKFVFASEFAIYSSRGAWGVLMGEDDLMVAGGTQEFIDALLRAQYVAPEDQVQGFVDYWHDARDKWGSDIRWLPRLLSHMFGDEQAQKFLLPRPRLERLTSSEMQLLREIVEQRAPALRRVIAKIGASLLTDDERDQLRRALLGVPDRLEDWPETPDSGHRGDMDWDRRSALVRHLCDRLSDV